MVVYYYGYSEFLQDSKELISKLENEYDTIVAVARGGLTLAHFIAEALEIRYVVTINSIGYDHNKKREGIDLSHVPDLSESKCILIVDDIVDSGETLEAVTKELKKRFPHLQMKTAALFYKKGAAFKPDFFVQYASTWIDFFWTRDMNDTHDR